MNRTVPAWLALLVVTVVCAICVTVLLTADISTERRAFGAAGNILLYAFFIHQIIRTKEE